LDLGIEAGPPAELEFANITSAITLPGGSLAVANSGTSQIRYFAATGTFIRSIGRRGQGPGEFSGAPLYLHARGRDTLLVYDTGNLRLTVLDAQGAVWPSSDLARADTRGVAWFPRLYPNAFLEADEAPPVRPCIDQLVLHVASGPDYPAAALLRVDQLGYLWATPLPFTPTHPTAWRIYDLSGTLVATSTLPQGFSPFEISGRFMLGRLEDSLGVEHVVVLPFGRERTAKLTCASGAPRTLRPDSAALRTLRNAARIAILAQEAYYASHAAYADRSDVLPVPELSALRLVIVASDKRHWFGLLIDPGTGTTCATGVGYQPPGWEEAIARCSSPAS
jgi:hypothetical protein